ncbi:proprotein convertase P-domain-containing protein [candidate division CSSED10-310 bacterium]|uniref:Proprotein convertase P-domain-containing protein n=1 Tax=candidate division CSSED10-310 bacterium TaxID=2855610 RepID=A0ABV6YT70_UNCC1
MMKKFFVAFIFCCFFTSIALAIDSGPVKVGVNIPVGITLDDGQWQPTVEGYVWTAVIFHEQANFIRIHFDNFNLAVGEYIEVTDPRNQKEIIYANKGLKELKNFWSGSIFSDTAIITYHANRQYDAKEGFTIIEYGAGTVDFLNVNESCTSTVTYENLRCKTRPSAVMANAEKIGHIVFVEGQYQYVCSGSLVSDGSHFLTNEHCMSGGQTTCNTYDVYFEYETTGTSCTSNSATKGSSFSCDQFVTKNACYDYALATLSGNPAGTYGYLEIDPNGVTTTSTNVYIIGHPAGYPKKLMGFGNSSNDVNAVNVDPIFPGSCSNNESDSEIEYEIMSQGGSSGSPVFNESTNKVVALHHAGWDCGNQFSEQGWGINMKKVYPEIESYLGGAPPSGDQLSVTVNITHTYIGDLRVVLTTPTSQTVVLHDNTGSSTDNIHTTYTITGWDGTYAGSWSLSVVDSARYDTGTLDSWSVAATPDGGSTHNASYTGSPIAIPDNNTGGITSTINMY